MSTSPDRIRLETSDLYSPAVETYLQMQQSLRRDTGELAPQPLVIRVIYSSWFYLMIACGLGAFLAWMFLEPFIDDINLNVREINPFHILIFPTVVGFVGLFLGAAEGIMCHNLGRAFICGIVGLGIGFGGGLVGYYLADKIFTIMILVAIPFMNNPGDKNGPTGIALLLIIMGRTAAWAVASIPAGLGQGIALREKKVVINGVVGAVLGGLIGGLLFDPINLIFTTADGEAWLSRMIGFTCIGLMVGLFVGLVEGWTKTAWLLMRAGPLAGKQFVLYRDTTVLGSSPKAEVYLFKDPAIEPRHAVIYNRGGRFEIEDCNTRDGTYVNGVPAKRQMLNTGDKVVLGKTVLEFLLKESH